MFFKNKNEDKILDLLNNIEKFIDNEINSLPKIDLTGSDQKILNKIKVISDKLEKKKSRRTSSFW
jgi:methyl-accepting chemotaxis protein